MKKALIEFFRTKLLRQHRWRIVATNGRIIAASSESFWNKEDCEHNLKITHDALKAHFETK